MRKVTAITAMDFNNAIGKNNKLLCSLKDDMEMFREKTRGSIVVMGSKTFASIGRPLPDRINIILTRDRNYPIPKCVNCLVMHSVDEVLGYFAQLDSDMYIIGGEQIYEQFLPYCNELIITRIETYFDGADAHFPQINWDEWESYPWSEPVHYVANDRNDHPFTIYEFYRR